MDCGRAWTGSSAVYRVLPLRPPREGKDVDSVQLFSTPPAGERGTRVEHFRRDRWIPAASRHFVFACRFRAPSIRRPRGGHSAALAAPDSLWIDPGITSRNPVAESEKCWRRNGLRADAQILIKLHSGLRIASHAAPAALNRSASRMTMIIHNRRHRADAAARGTCRCPSTKLYLQLPLQNPMNPKRWDFSPIF